MATNGTYYFDTASFDNATTLYTDVALTLIANNGWYSNDAIVRQQVSGVLFAAQACSGGVPTPTPSPVVPTPPPAPPTPPSPVAPSPVTPNPPTPPTAPSVPNPPPPAVPSPPTPPTPPSPVAPSPPVGNCYQIYLQRGFQLCSGSFATYSFNATTLSSATAVYSDSSCTTLMSGTYYFTQNNQWKLWTGSQFVQSGSC